MCVIYACKTTLPPESELAAGAFQNDDGAGLAWIEKGKVAFSKGFVGHKDLLEYKEKYKIGFPCVIHFRTASVGGKARSLCHPFPVDAEASLDLSGVADHVLFHNGHINNWDDWTLRAGIACGYPIPMGPWSDSRGLAWLTFLKGEGVIPFLIGHSRILVMSADEENPFSIYGSWIEKAGWSQSTTTTSYTPVVNRWNGPGVVITGDDEDELPQACTPKAPTTTPSGPSASSNVQNIWTVNELAEILVRIEQEQKDARTAAGL